MSLYPTARDWSFAWRDIVDGVTAWEVWGLLGFSDIRQRYRRSRFGQFWITLSTAIFIGGIGLVYSVLFKLAVHDYVPYLAVNMIVWTLISGTVGESTTAFTASGVFLRQDAMPRTIFIWRLLMRNLITFGHNIVIIPIVFIVFGVVPTPSTFLAIPGLLVLLLALFLISLNLGLLSTRFRDLPQVVTNALQLLFFITPIMWRASQLSEGRQEVLTFNPIAALLRLVSEPILGNPPPLDAYLVSFAFILVLAALTLPLFARFRSRIVYWL